MTTVTVNKLTETIGAEVVGVDVEEILGDDSLAAVLLEALEENGVLVFPKLFLDPPTQVAFCGRLGQVDLSSGHDPIDGVMRITLDPNRNPMAEYLRGTFNWHIDGTTLPVGQVPQKATLLTAHTLADKGGETEFASTYGGYDSLTPDEEERFGRLRVLHSVAATARRVTPHPSADQEAEWAAMVRKEQPLVWRHRSGRNSLVIGGTAEQIVGMDFEAGQALLDELLERTTAPGRVYRHEWTVGDAVMWDNRGVVHRALPYDPSSPREMLRTTLLGDEPIESVAEDRTTVNA